jgi:hypothetical protein
VALDPYAPPQATLDVGGPAPTPEAGFRTVSALAQALAWVMGLTVAVEIARIIDATVVGSSVRALAVRASLIETLSTLLFLTAVVLFCLFMARANRNARTFGALTLRYSPRWAVAAFFVPVMNLFAPYLAMKEIWQASDPDPLFPATVVRVPVFVPAWWGLYVLHFVTISFGTGTPFGRSAGVVARSLLTIAAALSAIPTVRGVARRQDHRQRVMASATATARAP